MKFIPSTSRFLARLATPLAAILLALPAAHATASLSAIFNSAADVPVTAAGYTAAGTVDFTLNFAPATGTTLTVVNNTGLAFIQGTFSNLAQGQAVDLAYSGNTYHFVAHYFGGTGNDLVLLWANTRPAAWGQGNGGELGNGTTSNSSLYVAVDTAGLLAGKTLIALAAGSNHSLGLCSDGTLAAWGDNPFGALGNNTTTRSTVPVAVSTSGVLAGKTVVAIAAGGDHSLALCSDGTLAAWGDGAGRQPYGGGMTNSLVPVAVDTSGVLAGRTVVAIATGANHSLALCVDGTVVAWGHNDEGQLGNGSTTISPSPVAVDTSGLLSGKTVIAISAGMIHSLALCSDGTVAAWGYNLVGQLGNNSTIDSAVPVRVDTSGLLAGKTVVAVSAGFLHSLALCSDGTVAAWGGAYGASSLLGSSQFQSLVPVAVDASGVLASKTVVAISAGRSHSLAQCSDGTVAAWGDNQGGELGSGGPLTNFSPVAVNTAALPAASRFIAATTGGTASHSLGLASLPPGIPLTSPKIAVAQEDGTSLSSGSGTVDFGNVPMGVSTSLTLTISNVRTAPMTLSGVTIDGDNAAEFSISDAPATSVAVGLSTALEITFTAGATGGRSAVLHIASDDMDIPSFSVNLTGTGISPGSGALSLTYNNAGDDGFTASSFTAAGSTLALALHFAPPVGKSLKVVNNTGLDFIHGTFSNLAQGQPVDLNFGGTAYHFVANYFGGTGNDLVLIWADSAAVGWGFNSDGQLGNNTTALSPVLVAVNTSVVLAGKTVIAVAAGQYHSLALCSDGTLAAWGSNSNGQLGNNTKKDSKVPVAVNTAGVLKGRTIIAVSAGQFFSLALCSDGTVAAWGEAQMLGNSFMLADSPVPVPVSTSGGLQGKTVAAISAGNWHSLALCTDGTVVYWGESPPFAAPVAINKALGLTGRTAIAISAGYSHDLILCSDGRVIASATNTYGATLVNNPTTSGVLAGRTVVAISAGQLYSLVLCSDGTVAAWGSNDNGELGNNSLVQSPLPVAVDTSGVLAGRTVTAICAGYGHSMALCSDGTAAAWGRNEFGQLGNNSTTGSRVPMAVSTVSLPAGARFTALTTGANSYHSLAIVATPPQTGVGTAGSYAGLVEPLDGTSPGVGTEGYFTATVQANRTFSAKLLLDGQTLSISGVLDDQGVARFGSARTSFLTLNRQPRPILYLTFKHDFLDDFTGTVLQQVRNSIIGVSTLRADRVFYNGKTPATTVPASYLGKANTPGVYTAMLPYYLPVGVVPSVFTPQTPGLTVNDMPLAYGFGTAKITAAGVVSFSGMLADGTAVTASAPLAHHAAAPSLTFPLFAQLYSKGGFISANVILDSTNPNSDFSLGTGYLHWCRPATNSQYYPYGWPQVIVTDLQGAKYAATPGQSVVPGLGPVNSLGNGFVTFDNPLAYLQYPANISSSDVVTYPSGVPVIPDFALSINRSTGTFHGLAPFLDGAKYIYQGIIYQKNYGACRGFALSPTSRSRNHTGTSTDMQMLP